MYDICYMKIKMTHIGYGYNFLQAHSLWLTKSTQPKKQLLKDGNNVIREMENQKSFFEDKMLSYQHPDGVLQGHVFLSMKDPVCLFDQLEKT